MEEEVGLGEGNEIASEDSFGTEIDVVREGKTIDTVNKGSDEELGKRVDNQRSNEGLAVPELLEEADGVGKPGKSVS